MCIDNRALNSKTLRNAYLLLRIQDCTDKLEKVRKLSSIDLLSGYRQLRVAEKNAPKATFNTRYWKYECLVMPFGLTNARATFQTLMNSILHRYIDKFILVYILVYSNSEKENLKHLALRANKLYAKLSKCIFNKHTLEFCGHIVGQGVVKVLWLKVKAIPDWPRPKTVHDVRQFAMKPFLLLLHSRFSSHAALEQWRHIYTASNTNLR